MNMTQVFKQLRFLSRNDAVGRAVAPQPPRLTTDADGAARRPDHRPDGAFDWRRDALRRVRQGKRPRRSVALQSTPLFWLSMVIGALWMAGHVFAIPITYRLAQAGNVSVAVYDPAGRMVRTLCNAETQSPGAHTLEWDGLAANGQPLPAGRYEWRLLQSPGLTTQYLMSLGTSVGYERWVGQHGGPACVAADEQGLVVGANPEGSPLLAKVGFDDKYLWNNPGYRAADSAIDGTIMDGRLYSLQNGGYVYVLDAGTGQTVKPMYTLRVSVQKFTVGLEKTVSLAVTNGSYLVRVRARMGPVAERLTGTIQGQGFDFGQLAAGETKDVLLLPVFNNPQPVEVKDGKLRLTFSPGSTNHTYAIEEIELLAPATRLDARAGVLVAAFPSAGVIGWIEPSTGHLLQRVAVPGVQDISVISADEVLVAVGDKILSVHRDGQIKPVITTGLQEATRLAFDPAGDVVWVYDGANRRQQVLKFDVKKFALVATFGRAGGRRSGLYKPEDFNAVSDLAADGRGGFLITECLSAPRRTAWFDGNGKLRHEWYGGQQFYTFAAPEPGNPNLVWMDSQWGWLMQVEVDYAKRDYKVRACYPWAQHLDPFWISTDKMARRMYPLQREINGHPETLLWFENNPGLLMRVDEAQGELWPVAMLANNCGHSLDQHPIKDVPKPWAEALEKIQPGLSAKHERRNWTGYSWADANGDGQIQGDELILLNPKVYNNGHGFDVWGGAVAMDQELNLYTTCHYGPFGGPWVEFPVHGYTPQGWPIWDWNRAESGPQVNLPPAMSMSALPEGGLLSLHDGGGDGYTTGDPYSNSGHGWRWPGNQTDKVCLCRWDAHGHILWQVGAKAARRPAPPGQLNYPIRISGELPGFVAVFDKIVKPCEFWSGDGLYVGGVFDARVQDGLPPRLYTWWQAGQDNFDPQHGRAALQYDMAVGGSVARLPNGDVLFFGAGWNNVPVYKLTGFDKITRQTGQIVLKADAPHADGAGTGLQAEYFDNLKLEGAPALTQTVARVWFEPSRPGFAWPGTKPPLSARWTGSVMAKFSEPYTFAVYSYGGGRLWIGGKLVVDQWNASGKYFTAPIPLEAGRQYAVRLDWHSMEAEPEAHLSWESLSQSIEHIPKTSLYPTLPANVPTVALTPSRLEVTEGGTPVSFRLQRTAPADTALTAQYSITGTASNGEDYAELTGTVVWRKRQTAATIKITPKRVKELEAKRSVILTLEPSANYTIDDHAGQGTAWVVDPDSRQIGGVKVSQLPNGHVAAAQRIVDGSGLRQQDGGWVHDADPAHMAKWGGWNIGDNWIVFDLGKICDVVAMQLWNYNAPETIFGAQTIQILASATDSNKFESVGEFHANQAPGTDGYTGEYIPFRATARYLKLVFKKTYSPPQERAVPGVGLAEVRFFGRQH